MSLKHRLLSGLLGGAAAEAPVVVVTPPAAGEAPKAEGGADDQVVDVVLASEARQATAAAEKKGFEAANARMAKVFGSPAGQANYAGAAFMLEHSGASADDIIAKLPGMPGAKAAADTPPPAAAVPPPAAVTPPPAPSGPAAVGVDLAETPKVELKTPPADGGAGGPDAKAIWAEEQRKALGGSAQPAAAADGPTLPPTGY